MLALLRTTVRFCDECDEVTPHSHRVVPVRKLVASAALFPAGWCFGAGLWPLGWLVLGSTVLLLTSEKARLWNVRCDRCRGKRLAELQKTGLKLGRNTEVSFL